MDFPNQEALRSFLLPGGALLLVATACVTLGIPVSPSALSLLFYVGCIAGVLLSFRFHSKRALFALISIFLAQHTITFFASGRMPTLGPGRIALEVISFLLPINFLLLTFWPDRHPRMPELSRFAALIFAESILVATLCRPGQLRSPALIRFSLIDLHLLGRGFFLTQGAVLAFLCTLAVLVWRIFRTRSHVEGGLFWSLAAAVAALIAGGQGHVASVYFTTSALILASALIETSYGLAYQDELTGLHSRRAFTEMQGGLEPPFAIAIADIDHFKGFNDQYGHDVGDQVLRMVAAKLANVGCGGRAFRMGGEEFAILFRDKTVADVLPFLELVRTAIEAATFRIRVLPERRGSPRQEPDRRTTRKGKAKANVFSISQASEAYLSVTVSIGVAEPSSSNQEIADVYELADKALYRAKRAGRNRIEIAAGRSRSRKGRLKSSIA